MKRSSRIRGDHSSMSADGRLDELSDKADALLTRIHAITTSEELHSGYVLIQNGTLERLQAEYIAVKEEIRALR